MNLRFGVCAAALLAAACSPKQMALNRMASALAESTSVYERDNDIEFVRIAAPSTLKTVEMLLLQSPRNPQLLLTACRGFTEYSYGFLHVESVVKAADATAAKELRVRAVQMYQRAHESCLSGLQIRHPGLSTATLSADPAGALRATTAEDVPWLYWTALSWGAEIVLAPNPIAHITEVATVRALLKRAKDLNDTWENGAIYEAMIPFDGLPPLLGGSPAAARASFDRAQQLQNGKSVFAYVALAQITANAEEKQRLLDQALAVDV